MEGRGLPVQAETRLRMYSPLRRTAPDRPRYSIGRNPTHLALAVGLLAELAGLIQPPLRPHNARQLQRVSGQLQVSSPVVVIAHVFGQVVQEDSAALPPADPLSASVLE